jgi:hypothetical protein
MVKVFKVVKIEMCDSWDVIATRFSYERAENVVKNYIQPDLMQTVSVTIIEAWTNEKPKPEWDLD